MGCTWRVDKSFSQTVVGLITVDLIVFNKSGSEFMRVNLEREIESKEPDLWPWTIIWR